LRPVCLIVVFRPIVSWKSDFRSRWVFLSGLEMVTLETGSLLLRPRSLRCLKVVVIYYVFSRL